ncbi:MAG: DUF2683 family protein [Flavobacterium sp.]
MSTQSIIILEPKTLDDLNVFKALAKALNVKFEVKEKPYNPEFVEKIRKSEEQYKKGKFKRVNAEDLENYLGNL